MSITCNHRVLCFFDWNPKYALTRLSHCISACPTSGFESGICGFLWDIRLPEDAIPPSLKKNSLAFLQKVRRLFGTWLLDLGQFDLTSPHTKAPCVAIHNDRGVISRGLRCPHPRGITARWVETTLPPISDAHLRLSHQGLHQAPKLPAAPGIFCTDLLGT